jgi:arylsulfatase A-like enzyme
MRQPRGAGGARIPGAVEVEAMSRHDHVVAIAGLLAMAAAASGCGDTRPNVLLITLDTTRADHMSCYGYSRPTTPNLDRLAERSVVYTRAISTSSWTLPAHASLFTGRFPTSHGARYDAEGPLRLNSVVDGPSSSYRARGLVPEEITLASLLSDAGYSTAAVVGGPWMKRVFGLDKGFDFYDDQGITVDGRRAEQVTAVALEWLQSAGPGPFFLFLNYFDPHGPYDPPAPYGQAFLPQASSGPEAEREAEIARYDGEILYMDHCIGELLDGLARLGHDDDTLIVVASDHGEALWDHNLFGHGRTLFQEEIHIPLLVHDPRGDAAPGRSDAPTQLTDVMPMVLDRLGLELPAGVQGGLPPRTGHPVIAEVYPLEVESAFGDWQALVDYHSGYKYLWNSRGYSQLFDLRNDPRERTNLIERESARALEMQRLLESYLGSLPPPGKAVGGTVDPETRKALESLGYVD